MSNLAKTAILGLAAALATAAPAAITFGAFTGNGARYLWAEGSGRLRFDPHLAAAGDGAYSGTFTVVSTTPLAGVDVRVGSNAVTGGQMSFAVSLSGGVGFVYQDAVATDGGSLMADGGDRALALRSYTVRYALNYAGDADSSASFSTSSLQFRALPVPEPAAFAAMGVGAFGLLRRRRR